MAKTRRDKAKEAELLVANDLAACRDSLGGAKVSVKTPFDRNVVTQFEAMETLLDYGMAHLGLNEGEEHKISHPVVMTEPPANLATSRACKLFFFFCSN